MKFLIGMICGLVVAITVPFAMAAAAQGTGQTLQKLTPLTDKPVEAPDIH